MLINTYMESILIMLEDMQNENIMRTNTVNYGAALAVGAHFL